jgi:predicted DNA-binding transcriptional regulator AlpA
MSTFDNLPDTGYIRQSQLIPSVVPVSPATLWRKCKAGQFPKPVKLSERVTAWRVGDVRAWLIAQAKAVQS